MLTIRGLLSLSDDELQLVHEAIPGDALWSCVQCCKRLRAAALASGGLTLAAAVAGDLRLVKWAYLRGYPLSRDLSASMLCHIAAARNDFRMLRWALANGGVGLHGSFVLELAVAAGNVEMVSAVLDHGCMYGRAYETAAIMGHIAIVQWLYQRDKRDSECSEQLRQTRMTSAAGCAAAHGHLELLEWLTDDERDEENYYHSHIRDATSRSPPEVTASWGRYILSAAARGGYLHIIDWAQRAGYPEEETKEEWTQAANLAWAAAEIVQRQRAGEQRAPRKMSFSEIRQMFLREAKAVAGLVASSALLLRSPAHEHGLHATEDAFCRLELDLVNGRI